MERYPSAVEAILKDYHEIGHHGYLHERPNELPADEELRWFQRAIVARNHCRSMSLAV